MDDRQRDKIELTRALRRALVNGELELHYQPIISLDDVRVIALEALARWRHPQRGLIPAREFIPAAEESQLILQLGEWALRAACAEAAGWPQDFRVAVNVSRRELESGRLADAMRSALAESGLAPERLEIELTESALVSESEAILDALKEISDLGATMALDHFGAGFSSLACLRRTAFSRVKIDRSLVSGLPGQRESAAFVRAAAELALSLGMMVTAEGVETEEQLRHARRLGCTEMQGCLLSRPRPAEEFGQLLIGGARSARDGGGASP